MIVPYTDQLACVEREIKLRQRGYPRMIAAERMTQAAADQEIRRMEAVAETLRSLVERERLL